VRVESTSRERRLQASNIHRSAINDMADLGSGRAWEQAGWISADSLKAVVDKSGTSVAAVTKN